MPRDKIIGCEEEKMNPDLSWHEKVDKIFEDMYLGRGSENPPMTVRIAAVEKSTEQIVNVLSRISWLLIAAVVGLVFNIIRSFVH